MGRFGGDGRKPRIRIALIAAVVLVVAAVVVWARIPSDTPDKVTVWFWLTLGIGVTELLVVALIDFIGDWFPRVPDLVTDLAEPWPTWRHLILVPAFFLLGMAIDGILVH